MPPSKNAPAIDELIAHARAEVGYREGRSASGSWNNRQHYSPAVPGLEWSQNQAWCSTFVSWLAMKAGLDAYYPRTASTDAGAQWFKTRGQWSEYPAVGAFGYLGTRGDMFHVFLVVGYDATYIYTIEGNTNDNGSPQGDGVYALKRRRDSASIEGYGYPAVPGGLDSADPARAPRPVAPAKPVPSLVKQARRLLTQALKKTDGLRAERIRKAKSKLPKQ